jgi:exodeoxyribonuclease-3
VQILEYPRFTLVNAYFPNSQEGGARVGYKVSFCEALLACCSELRKAGRNLLICGDFNIAHKPIDLKNPKANENNAGYLPQERAWMDTFIGAGYVDTFRMFNQEPGHYTWWTYRFKAREKNVGWRIDYHCVNEEFRSAVEESLILSDVMGSDHCPVLIRLKT